MRFALATELDGPDERDRRGAIEGSVPNLPPPEYEGNADRCSSPKKPLFAAKNFPVKGDIIPC